MAERIQLKEPGSELTMLVARVSPETVSGVEYLKFDSGQKDLLVPVNSVAGQLERLDADTPADLVGKHIKFSRSTKLGRGGKPYWNLDLASGNGAIPPTATPAGATSGTPVSTGQSSGSAGAPVGAEPTEKPRLDRLYLRATRLVLDEVVPLYAKAGIGCSDTAVAAMTATVFIAATKVET